MALWHSGAMAQVNHIYNNQVTSYLLPLPDGSDPSDKLSLLKSASPFLLFSASSLLPASPNPSTCASHSFTPLPELQTVFLQILACIHGQNIAAGDVGFRIRTLHTVWGKPDRRSNCGPGRWPRKTASRKHELSHQPADN